MTNFKKAERLEEVANETTVGPLQIGDPRYVDLLAGRQIDDRKILLLRLEDAAQFEQYAKIGFTGHRGCGKTTELNQLAKELSEKFFSVHLFLKPDLENDFDYTALFLWLVEELASRFENEKMPLNNKLVDDVTNWFAKKTFEDVESVK